MFTLITLSGPALGLAGYYFDLKILFWIGVTLAFINLSMNIASGVMKFPILPLLIVAVTAFWWTPWYYGGALGLLLWTFLESLGEIGTLFKS